VVSWLGVPLVAGRDVVGVLAAQSLDLERERFTPAHRDLLATIASQLAVALSNARLYAQTDTALAQRVQELSSILHTTTEAILLLDADTRVLMANRALATFLNLSTADLAGRHLSVEAGLLTRLGTSWPELHRDLAELAGADDFARRRMVLPGPPPREVERTLAPVRGAAGAAPGWLVVLRDVGEERALARLREDMAHMLIHDLRSPLGSILTSLALIEQVSQPGQPLEADIFDLLRLARNSGQQLLRLINQLLEIARLEAGGVPLDCQPASAGALVEAAAGRLQPAAESATVRLVVAAEPDLPPLVVDPELIGRVLDNLADNAIKFSPDGAEVRLWARRGAANGRPGQVVFGVTDQGPGISPEAQARLFQKFQRVPNVRGRRGGTGLGLSFCKLVVEAHAGTIWVESAPGRGATFAFSLAADGERTAAG
jgi:signal transduction histidine kinase